jgi:hypothetical protein
VALKLRECEIHRVQPLLELSKMATNGIYVSNVVRSSWASPPRLSQGSGDERGSGPRSFLLVLMFAAMYGARLDVVAGSQRRGGSSV